MNKYCVFETKLGDCGLVWSENKISGFQLPFKNKKQLHKSLKVKYQAQESSPKPWIKKIITKVQKHLSGCAQDFSKLPYLEQANSPFRKRVYQQLLKIPSGQCITYGELASKAGSPKAARAVGAAMAANKIPLLIPCHRVLSNNSLCGFSAPGGLTTKKYLLELEQALKSTEKLS